MKTLQEGIFIGTCGWSYPEWQGMLYTSTKNLLEQYLLYFNTAEINTTFYGTLGYSSMVKFKDLLKENQFFTAKIPHHVTHIHKLHMNQEARVILFDFLEKMKPMLPELKVFLIQLPPWDITRFGDLESFFSLLDNDYRYAVEFRHHSWLINQVYDLLESYNIAYVVVDEPLLPIDLRITTDFSYIRWHGHGTNPWYNWKYSNQALEDWRTRLEMMNDRVGTILGYWNNHFFGYGPTNALQILNLLNLTTKIQEEKLERMLHQLEIEQTSLDEF